MPFDPFTPPARDRDVASLLSGAVRMLGRRWSVLFLPALAYSLFVLRTLVLAAAMGEGGGRAARELHGPALRTLVPFGVGHVQIMPSVGAFFLLLLAEGAILWRARVEAAEIDEPRGSFLGDPRTLVWAWLACTLAYLAGALSGVILGHARPGWMAQGLMLPAAALTQALFTAQVMRFWVTAGYDDVPSWSLATRETARSLPALFTWELALAAVLTGAGIVQAKLHGGEAARLARFGILGVLAVRAVLFAVPAAIVVRAGSVTDGLRAGLRIWRSAPVLCIGVVLALALGFAAYGAGGGALSSFVLGPSIPPQVIRALLGYGALIAHLLAGYVVWHLLWRRIHPQTS